MSRSLRDYVRLGLGWALVLLGIAGLFLPVLQGILFLCIGLVLLSRRSPLIRWLVMRVGRRWPKFRRVFDAARAKATEWRVRFGIRRRYR